MKMQIMEMSLHGKQDLTSSDLKWVFSLLKIFLENNISVWWQIYNIPPKVVPSAVDSSYINFTRNILLQNKKKPLVSRFYK